MHQRVDGLSLKAGEERVHLLVVHDVAAGALDIRVLEEEQAHAREELLLIADVDLGSVLLKTIGDRPGDARFVGDAEYDGRLVAQVHARSSPEIGGERKP
jgi:hypothetical protein